MSELNARIVRLEPIRIASVRVFGTAPESEAWSKLAAWAEPRGLFDLGRHRVFGFDNPPPSEGSSSYGYEFWLTVGPEVKPEQDVEIKEFPGGLYAVARCEVRGDPWAAIPSTWEKVDAWVKDSPYKRAEHQWLEEHLTPPDNARAEWDMDLYLPISQ